MIVSGLSLRVAEVSKLRVKIDTLTDEVELKDLKLQIMPGFFLEGATKFRNDVAKLQDFVSENGANVAVMRGLRKNVAAVRKAVAALLRALKKSCN